MYTSTQDPTTQQDHHIRANLTHPPTVSLSEMECNTINTDLSDPPSDSVQLTKALRIRGEGEG